MTEKRQGRVQLKLKPAKIKRWQRAADAAERSRSRWIAVACDYAARVDPIPRRRRGRARDETTEGTVTLDLRVTESQEARWKAAAKLANRTLKSWMRMACDRFVRRSEKFFAPRRAPRVPTPRRSRPAQR